MKNQIKKLLALALSCITLVGICACAPEGETDGPISDVGNGEYVAPIVPDTVVHAGGAYKMDSGKTIGFLSSEIEPMADGAEVEGLTVQLTATVEPADAWNKEVDWSFAWAATASTEWSSKPVEEFIRVEPLTDGSTTANVTLTDYFHACAITITVTTRDGGFTASCDATCVSELDHFVVSGVLSSETYVGEHGAYCVPIYSGVGVSTALFPTITFKGVNVFGYSASVDIKKVCAEGEELSWSGGCYVNGDFMLYEPEKTYNDNSGTLIRYDNFRLLYSNGDLDLLFIGPPSSTTSFTVTVRFYNPLSIISFGDTQLDDYRGFPISYDGKIICYFLPRTSVSAVSLSATSLALK